MGISLPQRAENLIIKVLQANVKKPLHEIETQLYHAYPFGARKGYAYKVWLKKKKMVLDGWIHANRNREADRLFYQKAY